MGRGSGAQYSVGSVSRQCTDLKNSPLKTLESPRLQLREEVQVTQDLSPLCRLFKAKSVNQVPGWEGWEAHQAGTELGSPFPAFMAGESV